jgi:hypothetical protein
MKNTLILIGFFSLLLGCTSSTTKGEDTDTTVRSASSLELLAVQLEKQMADTDLQNKLEVIHSLHYTKDDGSSIEASATLNRSKEIIKVEESFIDKMANSYGTTIFYIKNKKKYASKERFEERTSTEAYFVERVSYYDENEKVVQTRIRKAPYEEDLDAMIFEIVANHDCSIHRAMQAINQEGPFTTYFQGFVISGITSYLIVGESGDNGYVSAVMLQYKTTSTNRLLQNQEKYLGKKLDIEFQKMVDNNGLQFQILLTMAPVK